MSTGTLSLRTVTARPACLLAELHQDVVFGLRLIVGSPGFSAITVLTLALTIGANTAVFTVINALLFRPLPVAAAHEVMRIQSGESTTSWPNYEDIRRRNDVFSDVAAHRMLVTGLASDDRPVRLMGEATSANFLSLLGVSAAIGRTFAESESRRDLVVLADHVWRGRFASDSRIVGRVLVLAGRQYEVVGVMPKGFRGVAPPGLRIDFWLPVDTTAPSRTLSDRALSQFEVVGRLKPGIEPVSANAAMRVLAQGIRTDHPDVRDTFVEMEVFSIQGFGAFEGIAGLLLPILAFLGLLTVLSGFVLLIACANIAGLLIGRAAARRREIAMRLALGAGPRRLVRQLLTESFLLATIAGTIGVLLAVWLAGTVNAAASGLPIPVALNVDIDQRVLAYTVGLTTLTSLIFGLAPARRAARVDLVSSLKDEGSGSTRRQRLRQALVIGQVATCTALLVWSGLFLRSLERITDVDPGFNPAGVLVATVELERGTIDDRRGEQIFVELQQRVKASPAVQSAGTSSIVPLAMTGREEFYVRVDGDDSHARHRVSANRVTPGWFVTLQIPLLVGRDFTWDDREGAPGVVIVNDTLARRFWGGDALGKRLSYGRETVEVVGIVRDSKYRTLGETIAPTVYQPIRQNYMSMMTLHVRTADMKATTAAITREMQQLAPEVVVDVTPMTTAVAGAVLPARIGAIATGAFGAFAMLLSALGVYGLVSFVASQRTREIGVRRAIGATTPDIVRLIVGSTAKLAAIGLAIGLCAGGLGAVVLGGFIFGISPTDPLTLVGVAVIVMCATVLASALPALRAAHADPLVALRSSR